MKKLTIVDPLVADYVPLEVQRQNIAYFADWLAKSMPGWFILPPVSVYSATGSERLLFSLRRDDVLVGVFGSPFQVLEKIGDVALTNDFYAHMREKKMLEYPPQRNE
ncbi:hypothetical protein [Noviherbaspirillum malthae]|uniref:hypothetical protein n=1 Tax=Noviherbaspirillum malthae TaxID=1260987 RepID=UPI00188EBA11|nr:hypothetical protein [Noviherbaspirillum malthae]